MSQAWKTVRVFISSTFLDMHAERDHLVRFVFPRLREELLKRRIHPVDIDLRWGVTSDQDALEVCREIIDGCRPRFICILGGRYGTIPAGEELSITASEIQYAVFDRLNIKEYRYFYFRDPQVTASIPEEAAHAGGYREFVQPEEVESYGSEQAVALACQRSEKLEHMKQAVVKAGFEPYVYPARWDNAGQRLVDLEHFGERVYADLLESINDEFGVQPLETLDEFAEENAAMETFIENRVEHFVTGNRQVLFDEMMAFAEARGKPDILVLTGQTGLGKSALFSKFYLDYIKKHSDQIVISHFVGASAGSTNLRRMLRRFCHEISRSIGSHDEVPLDVRELIHRFSVLLNQASTSRPIVLLIDALNQLDAADNAHTMQWLPLDLPAGVRVIISSLEHPALEALRNRSERIREIELQPLDQDGRRAIIAKFLQRYRKVMSAEQVDAVLAKPESGSPLYLLVALEELRTLGTYDEILDRIRALPGEVQPMFLWILRERLSNDPGFRDRDGQLIGAKIVRKFVSYLGASRFGLSQAELVDLIAPGDPLGNIAALLRLLRPYLMQRGELLDFYHNQLRQAVESEYLDEKQEQMNAHGTLVEYFGRKADPRGDATWSGDSQRGLTELPYHRYRVADASGDCQPLFALVDDAAFKRRQFEVFGRPQPVLDEIGYAVDLATRRCNPAPLFHYTMMRVNVTADVFKADLYRLITIAKDHPQHAREVIALIPALPLRRMALLLLAWLLCEDEGEREFVHELVVDAAAISTPPTVNQTPALLEIIKELYQAGFVEAKRLIGAIPDCPVRGVYQTAWENGPDYTRELAVEITKTASVVPQAPAEEVREFGQTQEFARQQDQQLLRRMSPEAFEEGIIELLGPSKASDVYFLIATDWIHAGHFDTAQLMINRGIYVSCSIPKPALRTLSALVELFGKAGNRDMAEEHADRVRTVARMMERIARAEYNLGPFQDALSDLRIAQDNLAQVWRPSGAEALFEHSLSGTGTEPDVLARLAHARQLLAGGQARPVPALLRNILELLGPGRPEDQQEAILISTYAMACVCKDIAIAAECAARLQKYGLDPQALYSHGERTRQTHAVLETLVNSDPRCVACAALCLRLEGLNERLFEFAQVASEAGADVDHLDAILSQVVQVPGIEPLELRKVSQDIIGTTVKSLDVPSGLGWYYFPGILLCAVWSGIVFTSAGLRAALTIPHLGTAGMVFAAAGLIGGTLDLLVWRFMHLWERPEVSRRLLAELPSLASLWVALMLLRPWFESVDRTSIGIGMLVAMLLSLLPGILMWRLGRLFTRVSARFVVVGTFIALIIAGFSGTLLPAWVNERLSPWLFGGVFLGGMLEIAISLDIIPKRIAVLRHYPVNDTNST